MASTYSTNLKLELMGTGDQSGTWGNTTNTNLGTLVEQAIVGYTTVAITDSAVDTTITIADGSSSAGRNYVLQLTGSLTANRNLIVPAVQKSYIIYNATTGGYSVTVKVSGQTGITIVNGKKAIVYNNGTDIIEVVNAPVTETGTQTLTNKTLTSPTISGGTINNASVGAVTPAAGSFTTLAASGTVSGTGFSNYMASPPAIGGTAANTIRGTTITATTAFSGPLNGTVGATTPSTGAFTTLSASSTLTASGTVTGAGFSSYLASPPAIGGTTPAAGSFTTLFMNGNLSLNGQTGTSGQTLISSGAGSVPTWRTTFVRETVANATGANVDFTGIPSWVKRITVMFNNVNLSSSQDLMVSLGTSGGFILTGYSGGSAAITATYTGVIGGATSGDGFFIFTNSGSANYNGHMTITNVSGNVWVSSHALGSSTTYFAVVGGGTIDLGGVATQLRVWSSGSFDSGTINIMYE